MESKTQGSAEVGSYSKEAGPRTAAEIWSRIGLGFWFRVGAHLQMIPLTHRRPHPAPASAASAPAQRPAQPRCGSFGDAATCVPAGPPRLIILSMPPLPSAPAPAFGLPPHPCFPFTWGMSSAPMTAASPGRSPTAPGRSASASSTKPLRAAARSSSGPVQPNTARAPASTSASCL